MAVVFISHLDNGVPKQDGLCIRCAKELGIKPVNDIISNMGLSDEDVERMSSEMESLVEGMGNDMEPSEDASGDNTAEGEEKASELPEESRAPAIDLQKLFRGAMQMPFIKPQEPKQEDVKNTTKKNEELKALRLSLDIAKAQGNNMLVDAINEMIANKEKE